MKVSRILEFWNSQICSSHDERDEIPLDDRGESDLLSAHGINIRMNPQNGLGYAQDKMIFPTQFRSRDAVRRVPRCKQIVPVGRSAVHAKQRVGVHVLVDLRDLHQ